MKSEPIDPDMLNVAMTVCRRNLLELDDVIDNPFKHLIKESEWRVLGKDEKKRCLKSRREKKIISLAPVRKQQSNPSPFKEKVVTMRDTSYKSPNIVTLKLPEIDNTKLYSTVKEGKGFVINNLVKDETLNSMIEERKILEPLEERAGTERKIQNIQIQKSMSNAHDSLLKDVRNI